MLKLSWSLGAIERFCLEVFFSCNQYASTLCRRDLLKRLLGAHLILLY
jgi:hypothetical protein